MLLQEGSMHNAIDLGLSMWDDVLNGASWVIIRKDLNIYRMPKLGETIRIVTYPAGIKRVFAYRDFWAIDSKGNTLAYAGSSWTLMNLDTRKMSPIPKTMYDIQEVDPGQRLPVPGLRLSLSQELREAYTYQVGHYDLDWNGHVNNVSTARLLLQGVPTEVFNGGQLSTFRYQVKAEVLPNQQLSILIGKEGEEYHHQLVDNKGNVLAMAISTWKED